MRISDWSSDVCSSDLFSTQDHAAAAIAATGVPVFAIKGESLADYWDYVGRIFDWGVEDGTTCNLILDDGGDASMFALWGAKLEAGKTMPAPENEGEIAMQRATKAFVAAHPGYPTQTVKEIQGLSEQKRVGSG